MVLIEAMKQSKDLLRKADDIKKKIAEHCVDYNHQTPFYGSVEQQTAQISEWLQAHSDILKEYLRLKKCITRTNLETEVPIQINGKTVVKTITEWIIRRDQLAEVEENCFNVLCNNLNQQKFIKVMKDGVETIAEIRYYFSPQERDKKIEEYRDEPCLIDQALEIKNATTELIE